PECADDVTDYSRPSPTLESSLEEYQNRNPSASKNVASPITPKQFVKFVKANDSQSKSKTDEKETPEKPPAYSRPSPTLESSLEEYQNRNPSASKNVASPITPKQFVKFVKASNSQFKSKTDEKETPEKPPVKITKQYRKPNKKPNVRGNQRNWNNLKSNQLGPDFVMKKRSIPSQRKSTVRSQYRALRVPTVNRNFPPVNRKFSTGSRNFPTANKKLSTASRKVPTGSIKGPTVNMGMKGKAIRPSVCWSWNPLQNLSNKEPKNNSVSDSSQNHIDDKGYWDSGCSRHMTSNISYLSDYEPFDGGYVSFGQGGCKITGKGTIKTGKLEFENVYFVKDLSKDVSSLRYIVLPNWGHEEHLESTSSQPQGTCNTDVSESSGNSNPTATSTNPPNDQLETLTVKTPIPTASSPVPTVCFSDSQEPSSATRLISKRVTNQEKIPSLDNILTLTNQFEDILGDTSNSKESNRVKAELSYMETTITSSPTPTLRIHRDHPKSQIISPMDTLIQTRNKSKEVGEQSFIAIIHQKTDPALL
nr:hypothetical protein [Tanacetum cinerariifolium]